MNDLWCPIEVRRSAVVDLARAHRVSAAWAVDVGLVAPGPELEWYSRWNPAEFTTRVYGRCENEAFDLATQWFGWMNVLDDRLESLPLTDLPAQLQPLDAVFRDGHDDRTPLSAALSDLWARTRTGMSPGWRQRMAYLWGQCSNGFLWEARNRATGRPPPLPDYMARRPAAGGAEFCLSLVEGLYQDELHDELYYSAPLVALRASACEHICWANDILTLDREVSHGDVHNLVLVLEKAWDLSRSKAIAATVRMTDARMRAITSITATFLPAYADAVSLRDDDRARLARSVDAVEQWVAGSLEFHRISTRHRDHHSAEPNPFKIPGH